MAIDSSNNKYNDKAILIPSKNIEPIYYDDLNLHDHHNYYHYLQNIAGWKYKDKRLESIEIPTGLIEVLQNTGFTIEKILDNEPSVIAEKLGIDPYIGKIILKETKRAVSKINPDLLRVNK